MQKRVENKVLEYCKKHKLLDKGERIVVGVSGGADSVCLLFVLLSLQESYDLRLFAVHVHHGIRLEAGEDAAYVEKLCEEKAAPLASVDGAAFQSMPAISAASAILTLQERPCSPPAAMSEQAWALP